MSAAADVRLRQITGDVWGVLVVAIGIVDDDIGTEFKGSVRCVAKQVTDAVLVWKTKIPLAPSLRLANGLVSQTVVDDQNLMSSVYPICWVPAQH